MRSELTRLSRNLLVIYIIRIFSVSGALIVPNIVLFTRSHGVSQGDFFLIEMCFAAAFGVAQIPTGRFADRFGRRRSMLIGSVMLPISMAFYVFGDCFRHFVIGEMIGAIGFAFVSGADEALFYESLVVLKRSHRHGGLWGRAFVCGFVAMAIGNAVGGWLAQLSPRAPFIAATIGFIAMSVMILQLNEPKRRRRPTHEDVTSLGSALKMIAVRPDIRWYVLFSGVSMIALQVSLWTYQNYFLRCGIDEKWHGLIVSSFNVWAAVAALNAVRLERWIGRRLAFTIPMIAIGAGLVMLGAFPFWETVAVIALQQSARGFIPGMFSGYLNRLLPFGCRATMLSVKSGYELLSYVLLLFLAKGIVAGNSDITIVLLVLGAIVLCFGTLGALVRPKDRVEVTTHSKKQDSIRLCG